MPTPRRKDRECVVLTGALELGFRDAHQLGDPGLPSWVVARHEEVLLGDSQGLAPQPRVANLLHLAAAAAAAETACKQFRTPTCR